MNKNIPDSFSVTVTEEDAANCGGYEDINNCVVCTAGKRSGFENMSMGWNTAALYDEENKTFINYRVEPPYEYKSATYPDDAVGKTSVFTRNVI